MVNGEKGLADKFQKFAEFAIIDAKLTKNTCCIRTKILFFRSGNMILKTNKIFPNSERNKNFLKTVEVEYFVRTNRTSSATVEM